MTVRAASDDIRLARVEEKGRVAGGVVFDWFIIVACTWMLGGAYLDAWAHNYNRRGTISRCLETHKRQHSWDFAFPSHDNLPRIHLVCNHTHSTVCQPLCLSLANSRFCARPVLQPSPCGGEYCDSIHHSYKPVLADYPALGHSIWDIYYRPYTQHHLPQLHARSLLIDPGCRPVRLRR